MHEPVLFVTHKPKQCGVYEFGKNIFDAIQRSTQYRFIKAECESFAELSEALDKHKPKAVIYNYHPSVMPWVCAKITKGLYRNQIANLTVINIGIIHEITQEIADAATGYRNSIITGSSKKKLNSLFDFYIAADPTLLLKNPLVYKTGRLIPEYKHIPQASSDLVFGSFGFATPKKGFERVVARVQEEFDEATIRFNIPPADFGDKAGENARGIASKCKSIVSKPGIKLEITHDYLNSEELLHFLAQNSINVFMYEDSTGRGISSAADMALAVNKPVAVSRCPMFRHILDAKPSICTDDVSLKTILNYQQNPLEKQIRSWDKENMLWEFERILARILSQQKQKAKKPTGLKKQMGNLIRRTLTMPDKNFSWLRTTSATTEDDMSPLKTTYSPVLLQADSQFNRILNDEARNLYQPAIKKLKELVPLTMAKKIERASVQQAFVFDTVYRHLENYDKPKILCVGSYEDTASMALIRMGYEIEEIDPMINYFLQEYYTKPGTQKNAYQIIFSTSVIEHDPDDESFMKCISGLLAPGGVAILTCDYKDGWTPGEPKPDVDARLYTKKDLEQRLLSYIPECELLDTPDWTCVNPDFNYLGRYQYTFATFSIRKKH